MPTIRKHLPEAPDRHNPPPPPPPPNSGGSVPSYDTGAGQSTARNYTVDVTDTAEDRCCPIVYGKYRYRPQVVHCEIVSSYLHMVYLLSEGEIDSLVYCYIGETEIYAATQMWASTVFKPGSTSQTEITDVPQSNWSSSYPGKAILYVKLNLTSAEFAGGNPDIEVVVKGRKLYDPRTSTSAWSENPFLIAYDLLTNTEYGAGVSPSNIDSTSWQACMNRCDETVDSAARWRASTVITNRRPVVETARDILNTTCGGVIYWADGKWYARLDEQNVIGCRPTGTTAVGTTDRAQSFVAPGPLIKAVLKLNLAGGFTNPTLRLRSTLGGSDLDTDTATGYSSGDNQSVTFDLTGVRLTKGNTYYLVLNATTGVTWHQIDPSAYADGSSWNNSGGWTQETTKDFWFQVHFVDHEIRDALTATSPEIPILASAGKTSLSFARSKDEAPNVVEVTFYDQSNWVNTPVRYESSEVQAGSKQPNILKVNSLAVPSGSCGYRLARQWYKVAQRTNRLGCLVPMHGAAIAPLDVVAVTSASGPLTAAWYRVRSVQRRLGCFQLELVEYNWSDYSTEETTTLDSITLPTSASANRWMNNFDDFRWGSTTEPNIGELGWSLYDNTMYPMSVAYSSESDHPGILTLSINLNGNGGTGYLGNASDSKKYPLNSAWSFHGIWKCYAIGASGQVVTVKPTTTRWFEVYNSSGTWYLRYWNGSTYDSLQSIGSTWLEQTAVCDGNGTVLHTIRVYGGSTYGPYSETVSGSTLTSPTSSVEVNNSGYSSSIKLDLLAWSIGMNR